MSQPDSQLLCLITLTGEFILPPQDPAYPPIAYSAVFLIVDARTGNLLGTTGTPR
jgi:hypothetical protein